MVQEQLQYFQQLHQQVEEEEVEKMVLLQLQLLMVLTVDLVEAVLTTHQGLVILHQEEQEIHLL